MSDPYQTCTTVARSCFFELKSRLSRSTKTNGHVHHTVLNDRLWHVFVHVTTTRRTRMESRSRAQEVVYRKNTGPVYGKINMRIDKQWRQFEMSQFLWLHSMRSMSTHKEHCSYRTSNEFHNCWTNTCWRCQPRIDQLESKSRDQIKRTISYVKTMDRVGFFQSTCHLFFILRATLCHNFLIELYNNELKIHYVFKNESILNRNCHKKVSASLFSISLKK